jgi:hypothetical protein
MPLLLLDSGFSFWHQHVAKSTLHDHRTQSPLTSCGKQFACLRMIHSGSLHLDQTFHLPHFTPASPILRRDPFDHPDYIFELKHDGFRALAYVERDGTRLVSRRGNVYRGSPPCATQAAVT